MLVILYRRDDRGTAHYYTLDDRQQAMFGLYNLVVSWGTAPEGTTTRTYTFATLEERNKKVRSLLTRKLRTHKVFYSYFKPANSANAFTHGQKPLYQGALDSSGNDIEAFILRDGRFSQ